MLIEIWEQLRGYAKWSETQAIIESAEVHKEPVGERGLLFITTSADTLVWNDQSGQKHSTSFVVPDSSPLFALKAGDMVTIRYHPAQPDRFYWRELSHAKTKSLLGNLLAGTCAVLLLIAYFAYHWARIHFRRSIW